MSLVKSLPQRLQTPAGYLPSFAIAAGGCGTVFWIF
jgi:hypothetical protein